MASVKKELGTAYVFGTPVGATGLAPANCSVLSFSTTKSYGNVQEVLSQDGNVLAKRMDDRRTTGTITLAYKAAFAPLVLGTTIAYDGTTYNITGVNNSHTNNGFRESSYNIELKEYITPA